MKKISYPISVVSPVYNAQQSLVPVVTEILDLLESHASEYELFLIDDGSGDKTASLLRSNIALRKGVRVSYHQKNQGTAKTYRELYQNARFDKVILFSLDGEWNPLDIIRLAVAGEKEHLVIGKRTKKAYPLGRLLLSEIYNMLTVLLFSVKTSDAGSIKLLSKEIINTIPIISSGVFDEAERIIRAAKRGYSIQVIPVDHRGSKKMRGLVKKIPLIVESVKDMGLVWLSLRGFIKP